MNTVDLTDIISQLRTTLGEYSNNFNVTELAKKLDFVYNLTGPNPENTLDNIDQEDFWRIVQQYDMTL